MGEVTGEWVIDRTERLDLTTTVRGGPVNVYEHRFVREAKKLLPAVPVTSVVTFVADRPVDPLLVRAYRDGWLRDGTPVRKLCAYAVRDQFGWAVMTRLPVEDAKGRSTIQTLRRYEDDGSRSTVALRSAALVGLARVAGSRAGAS